MTIPREGDIVRFYVQLLDTDIVDPSTGRVDVNKMSAEDILSVS
jgi:phenol 2-monooxygenase (NADPH)